MRNGSLLLCQCLHFWSPPAGVCLHSRRPGETVSLIQNLGDHILCLTAYQSIGVTGRAEFHICIPSPPCLIFLFSLIDVFKRYILIDFYTQNRILYSWLCCQIFDQNFKKNPTKIGKCEQKLILQWLHTWHENLVIFGKLSVACTELNCSYWWNSVVFLFLPFVLQQL